MFDVCIIGSGPSGLAAAITAAKRGAKVKLLDKNKKSGKKLYATGNGKCNITNRIIDVSRHYHSDNQDYIKFLSDILGEYPYKTVNAFMASIGILTYTNNEGYCYPVSNQASSVVWALNDALNQYNVDYDFKAEVTNINKIDNHFVIDTINGQYLSHQIIFACGSKCYSSLGGCEFGYEAAKGFGHSIIKIRPSLCGMYTKDRHDEISGVRSRATAELIVDGQKTSSETGEIQFTSNGLSGIAIFNLSSLAGKALLSGKKVSISLDLTTNIEYKQIVDLYDKNQNRTILGALNGVFNDKLCGWILEKQKISAKSPINEITKDEFIHIVNCFSNVIFDIQSLYDFEQAQVCSGGININEINSNSCESKLVPNAYFIGEMLDIDGICGGYNITFALLSGICAGEHIYVTN